MDIRETYIGTSLFFRALCDEGTGQSVWDEGTGQFRYKVAYELDELYEKLDDKLCDSKGSDDELDDSPLDVKLWTCECPSQLIADIIFADYQLRYQTQLKDNWMEKNAVTSTEDWASVHELTLQEFDKSTQQTREIDSIRRNCVKRQRDMYLKESSISYDSLGEFYDSLRKDPAWYMRKELVKECAAADGCCARSCGCCAKRLETRPRKEMSGHCSLACLCCEKERGCSLSPDDIDEMDQQYKDALEGENPFFLLRVGSAYFAPQRVESTESSVVVDEEASTSLGTRTPDTLRQALSDDVPTSNSIVGLSKIRPSQESHVSDANEEGTSTSSTGSTTLLANWLKPWHSPVNKDN